MSNCCLFCCSTIREGCSFSHDENILNERLPQLAREEVVERQEEAVTVTRRATAERIIVGGVLIIDVVLNKWLRRKPNIFSRKKEHKPNENRLLTNGG